MRLVHVITGLQPDGAERFLLRLVQTLPTGWRHSVISLSGDGPIGEQLRAAGVEVHILGMSPGRPDPRRVFVLARMLRALEPDVVQTWMYHADLIGGLAARMAKAPRMAWAIRHSNLQRRDNKLPTLAVAKACALLSRILPDAILCNSETAKLSHARFGYDAARIRVIPNGFDLDQFRPDADARRRIRDELGLAEGQMAIGMVGRFDVQKGHEGFFRAAALVARRRPDAVFVLAGRGVDELNPAIAGWIVQGRLDGRVRVLGPRDDMPALLGAIDLLVLPSLGEAFPNALGEAMACETPCIATDVGDSSAILGGAGVIVPPRDPAVLAAAMEQVMELGAGERAEMGRAARARVARHFSLEAVSRLYAEFYEALSGGSASPPHP